MKNEQLILKAIDLLLDAVVPHQSPGWRLRHSGVEKEIEAALEGYLGPDDRAGRRDFQEEAEVRDDTIIMELMNPTDDQKSATQEMFAAWEELCDWVNANPDVRKTIRLSKMTPYYDQYATAKYTVTQINNRADSYRSTLTFWKSGCPVFPEVING